ncbi:MAG: hypothetical protein V4576_03755 [Patescibacteria group bacterium]
MKKPEQPIPVREWKNFGLWEERVFPKVKHESGGAIDLNGDTILISEAGGGDGQEISVCGIFEQEGKRIVINCDYHGSWGVVSALTFTSSPITKP